MINWCYKKPSSIESFMEIQVPPKWLENGIFENKNSYRPEIHNNEACFSAEHLADIWCYKMPFTAFPKLASLKNYRCYNFK